MKFRPKRTGPYDMVLVVNIIGVGDDMLSIPIKAVCRAPNVNIDPIDDLDFGKVFLDYPKVKTVSLDNTSDLKAKFIILP